MAKSRSKSRLHSLRCSPLICSNRIDLNTISDQLLDEIKAKLTSSKPSDRHLGADMVSNSISSLNNYNTEQIIELIRILSPLCCDRAENVRYATIDALNHLSSLSDEFCDIMIESDVMTALIALFNRFNDHKWDNNKASQLTNNIYIDSCHLFTNLCGTSSKALKLLNNSNLVQILFKGLKSFNECIEVSIASAECLSVVVEENIIADLLKEENIELIKSLLIRFNESPSQMHLSNLMAFIVTNLNTKLDSNTLNLIFNVIDSTLSVSCLEQLKQFSEHIKQFVESGKPTDLLTETYEQTKNLLLAKRVALELFTNITSLDDDCSDEDMECDQMNDSDDEDTVVDNSETIEDSEPSISPELQKLILEKCVLSKVVDHLGSVDNQLSDNLVNHNFGKQILNCIESVQECSLTCIHNLVLCIPKQKLQMNEFIWNRIYNIAFTCNRLNLIEESTNTMRAIITRYNDINLTSDELERLCIVCHNKNASNIVKINIIKLMSVLAERSSDLVFIEKICLLLVTALQNEVDLVIRAEIFDAIIDIFSEDFKTDEIMKKMNLINMLKEWALVFKKEANKNRNKWKENPIISTVKLNLARFIQYKQKMLNIS